MDVRNGDLYASRLAALEAGVPPESVVEVIGDERAVKELALAIQERAALAEALREARLTGGSDAVTIKPIPGNTDSGDELDDR